MYLEQFEKYKRFVLDNVISLPNKKAKIYNHIIALKFYNFYELFSEKDKFGNKKLLLDAQEYSKLSINNEPIENKKLNILKNKIEKQIPDSDDFPDCSDAMDAAAIHVYLLDYIITGNNENISYISGYVYDLLDRYAQEELEKNHIQKITEDLIGKNFIIRHNIENDVKMIEEIQKTDFFEIDVDDFIDKYKHKYVIKKIG